MLTEERKKLVLECRERGLPQTGTGQKAQRIAEGNRLCALQDVFGQAGVLELRQWYAELGKDERNTWLWVCAHVMGVDTFGDIVLMCIYEGAVSGAAENLKRELAGQKQRLQAESDVALSGLQGRVRELREKVSLQAITLESRQGVLHQAQQQRDRLTAECHEWAEKYKALAVEHGETVARRQTLEDEVRRLKIVGFDLMERLQVTAAALESYQKCEAEA